MKYTLLSLSLFITLGLSAQKRKSADADPKHWLESASVEGLKFRSIGPATTSGRIADLAVNPNNHSEYYLAIASGNVFKTNNNGITFQSIFDNYGSYSIGCVSIDPNNTNVVWIGTGENNNQRSVAYGDGVYKSIDGGKSFTNMGLKNSEHIGMITLDPRNSDVVYVAAYGPLWSAGGDRGLYKTTDGGKTWNKILDISENTGVNEVHLDPRNPDVIYATAHQRRRHVFTYLSGGPESALYKSTDGGKSFEKLTKGLPSGDAGRYALAISPVNPDLVYVMVEGHGFYRSSDRGASFSKMSDHYTSGNYYVEIYAHPHEENTIFSMDTYAHWSRDGGKTFTRIPEKAKHVDNHCMWINPNNPNHILMGCDGGLYETFDYMENWQFKPNLPTVQFYRVAVDNDYPFYNVYGGTQDNNTLGGPARTRDARGIVNDDWYVTQGGDGFKSQVDPKDPNIVYSQAQYGWLVRFDRKSGEHVPIQPQPAPDEEPYVWNWDAPLLISPHDNKTLYFAANKVFKSTDRGNTWTAISDNLTQKIDRNKLKVMGRTWSMDAVAYHQSTSFYGNLVSFDESKKKKGLLYAGSDDGLIHVSQNDGGSWKRYSSFPGVPANTYVQDVKASQHDENVVYAAFNNHKNGDFKPYVLRSSNQGTSWLNITGNLPERGSIYVIAEDPVNSNLLFAGTEFGVFFTIDGGKHWKKLSAGLPTIAVRDIAIQERENDLVLATFGRGFYILDDYSPLRTLSEKDLNKEAHIFPIKDGLFFHQSNTGGIEFKGASYYMGENPPIGATITYHIKEKVKTLKEQRQAREKDKTDIPYPSFEEIRAEDAEEKPYLIFVISDAEGREVRRMNKTFTSGLQRITWDGRYNTKAYLNTNDAPITNANTAMVAPEGQYFVQILNSVNGRVNSLTDKVAFNLKHLENSTLPAEDKEALFAFQQQVDATARELQAVENYYKELSEAINHLKAAARNTPGTDVALLKALREYEEALEPIKMALYGDASIDKREFITLPGLRSRMGLTTWSSYYNSSEPTGIQKDNLRIVQEALPDLTESLKKINVEVQVIKATLYEQGTPFLKGDLK